MHLCLNDSKLFHTSAVYAAAVNTISLPFRMEPSGPTSSSWSRGVGSTDLSSLVQLCFPLTTKESCNDGGCIARSICAR
jgi:hypothetical protein